MVVERQEDGERLPSEALVAVGQRMVPCDADGEDSRLLFEVRVEVLVAEPRLRGVER